MPILPGEFLRENGRLGTISNEPGGADTEGKVATAQTRRRHLAGLCSARRALGHKRVLSDGLLLARLKTVRPLYRDSPSGGTRPADVVEAGDDVATIRLFRRLVRERKVSLSNVPARVRLHLSRS
jgi:hypothetical protein